MGKAGRNKLFEVIIASLRTAAMLCATGTLMQTFLSTLGFNEDWIYLHSTLVQAISVLTILLGARFADTTPLRRAAWMQLPTAVLFLAYIPLCIWKSASFGSFALLMGVGAVQTVANGLYTVCAYKLPYLLYESRDYGTVLSWTGVATSAVSFVIGALVSALSAVMPYEQLMLWGFLVSAVLMLLAFFLQRNMRPLRDPQPAVSPSESKKKVPLKTVLTAPVFRNLILANLMRGFANGTISVLPVMAITLGYDQTVTTAMVSVSAVATLLGCGLFGFLGRRLPYKKVAFLGSIAMVPLCAMLISNLAVFLTAYGVLLAGKIVVDNSVPAALLRVVPMEIAGPYNAWRMILHFSGTLLGTAAATVISVPVMLIASSVMQLLSGWVYAHAAVMNPNQATREV